MSWLPGTWNANLVVWACIWGGLWGFQAVALATRPTLPSFGDVIVAIQRSRVVRASLLAGWAWWGWHVFVRGGW